MQAFNSGRHYSDKGQRIAYMLLGTGTLMVDIDRGIEYFLYEPCVDSYDVMEAYDSLGRKDCADSYKYPQIKELIALASQL